MSMKDPFSHPSADDLFVGIRRNCLEAVAGDLGRLRLSEYLQMGFAASEFHPAPGATPALCLFPKRLCNRCHDAGAMLHHIYPPPVSTNLGP